MIVYRNVMTAKRDPYSLGELKKALAAHKGMFDQPADWPNCDHSVHLPDFDLEVATMLPAHLVRKVYPRFDGKCSICGRDVVLYASHDHMVEGEW